jgi:uncharacterized protein YciI
MKIMKCAAFAAAWLILATACGEADGKKGPESPLLAYMAGKAYDEAAAREFAADEYGMRKYVLAFLKRGPNRPTDKKKAEELQAAHLKNIDRMAAAGKLALAGPFLGDGELRGIYVFCVDSVAEAEALTQTDPAVQAGSLVMELKEWYGSAALMALNTIHARLKRKPVAGE